MFEARILACIVVAVVEIVEAADFDRGMSGLVELRAGGLGLLEILRLHQVVGDFAAGAAAVDLVWTK